jgi:hypothetical protein
LFDAALCGLTALAFHRKEHHLTDSGTPYGNSEEGFIVLPQMNWRLQRQVV